MEQTHFEPEELAEAQVKADFRELVEEIAVLLVVVGLAQVPV